MRFSVLVFLFYIKEPVSCPSGEGGSVPLPIKWNLPPLLVSCKFIHSILLVVLVNQSGIWDGLDRSTYSIFLVEKMFGPKQLLSGGKACLCM